MLRRLHYLRHTCATLLLCESVHPKLVQELLVRPANISITLDTYSHVLLDMEDQTTAAMESAAPREAEAGARVPPDATRRYRRTLTLGRPPISSACTSTHAPSAAIRARPEMVRCGWLAHVSCA